MHNMEPRMSRHMRRGKAPVDAIITGLVIGGAFGVLWLLNPHFWWCIFPIVFAGLMPFLKGIGRLLSSRRDKKPGPAKLSATQQEKQILQAAHDQKGRLTAAGAALRTNLSIQESSQLLDRMTKEGYAVMNVTSAGTIEYEFPDFLPEEEKNRLT
jgi:hypothetical protein